jgi:hypothetical protein
MAAGPGGLPGPAWSGSPNMCSGHVTCDESGELDDDKENAHSCTEPGHHSHGPTNLGLVRVVSPLPPCPKERLLVPRLLILPPKSVRIARQKAPVVRQQGRRNRRDDDASEH